MNQGKFFSVALGVSRMEEGLCVFNYMDIFDDRVVIKDGQTTPRYPIFVSITPTSVKFILQYCVYLLEDRTLVPSLDLINEEKTFQIRHMEEVLIELPLTDTQGLSLSSTLKRLYDTPFPIKLKDRKSYIQDLIEKRYGNGCGQYDSMRQRDQNRENIHYSCLPIWELYDRKEERYKLCNNAEKYNKVLRKLVLDFFFDVMHGDVFKNSMYFDQMYSRFMSDYFCSAILYKSEFYYQRALVCDLLKNNLSISDSLAIYADNFDKAEDNWIKCIQSQESDNHFEFKPNWFEDEKKEKGQGLLVFFKTLWGKFRKWTSDLMCYQPEICNSWFASPEEELKRVYYREKDSIVASSEELFLQAKSSSRISIKNASFDCEQIQQRRRNSSKWFLRRYNFEDSYRLSFFSVSNICLIVFLVFVITYIICYNNLLYGIFVSGLLAFIVSIFLGVECYKKCYKSCIDTKCRKCRNFDCDICCFGLKVGVQMFCYFILNLKIFFKNIFKNIHLFYPRLISSIAAAWLTIALSEDLYKAFFDLSCNWNWLYLLVGFVLFFVFYEVNVHYEEYFSTPLRKNSDWSHCIDPYR